MRLGSTWYEKLGSLGCNDFVLTNVDPESENAQPKEALGRTHYRLRMQYPPPLVRRSADKNHD